MTGASCEHRVTEIIVGASGARRCKDCHASLLDIIAHLRARLECLGKENNELQRKLDVAREALGEIIECNDLECADCMALVKRSYAALGDKP
jgi:hypothetical protein